MALLRRAVRPGGPRAHPAVRADGRHAADPGPLARGPRGGDRRARGRRSMPRTRSAPRSERGSATYLLLPRAGCARGGARRRRHQPRPRGSSPWRWPGERGPRPCRHRPPQPPDASPRRRAGSRRPGPPALLVARPRSRGSPAWSTRSAWARLVSLVFGSSVYAFGLMLLQFLGGHGDRQRDLRADPPAARPARARASRCAPARPPRCSASPRCPGCPSSTCAAFPAVRDSFWLVQLWQILETAPVLLPLAISFGVAFPAAIAAIADVGRMGRGVGRVTRLEHGRDGRRRVSRRVRARAAVRPARRRSRWPRPPPGSPRSSSSSPTPRRVSAGSASPRRPRRSPPRCSCRPGL